MINTPPGWHTWANFPKAKDEDLHTLNTIWMLVSPDQKHILKIDWSSYMDADGQFVLKYINNLSSKDYTVKTLMETRKLSALEEAVEKHLKTLV